MCLNRHHVGGRQLNCALTAYSLKWVSGLWFNVLSKQVIWRLGLGLKAHPKDWRSRGLNCNHWVGSLAYYTTLLYSLRVSCVWRKYVRACLNKDDSDQSVWSEPYSNQQSLDPCELRPTYLQMCRLTGVLDVHIYIYAGTCNMALFRNVHIFVTVWSSMLLCFANCEWSWNKKKKWILKLNQFKLTVLI